MNHNLIQRLDGGGEGELSSEARIFSQCVPGTDIHTWALSVILCSGNLG